MLDLMRDLAAGRFPPADGEVEVRPAVAGAEAAVLGFSAHHVILADVPAAEVRARLPRGELTAPLSVAFLAWLAERTGAVPGSLDVVLVWGAESPAPAAAAPVRRVTDSGHPRVARALGLRADVSVYAGDGGVVVLGRGLAGRLELSVEVEPRRRGAGVARALVAGALAAHAPAEPVFAQVAPANAASLRALLAAGFGPVGAEVLFHHGGIPGD